MAIRPQGVAVNPSCTASTFANSNGTVSVINTETNTAISTLRSAT